MGLQNCHRRQDKEKKHKSQSYKNYGIVQDHPELEQWTQHKVTFSVEDEKTAVSHHKNYGK